MALPEECLCGCGSTAILALGPPRSMTMFGSIELDPAGPMAQKRAKGRMFRAKAEGLSDPHLRCHRLPQRHR